MTTNTMFEQSVIEKEIEAPTLVEHMKAVTKGSTYREIALAKELESRQYEYPEIVAHIVSRLG